eukprot:gene15064-17804_t
MSLAFTSGLFLLLVTEMQFKTHEAAMLVPADTPLQSEITLQEYTAVPEVAKAEAPFEAEWSEDEETQSPSEPQEQGEEGAFEDERNMPHTAGLYLFVMLLLGLCTKALLASRHFRDHQIPFTVAVLVLGVLIGVAYQPGLGEGGWAAIRAVVVLCFYPVLKFLGYGLHWKDAAVLVWSGLRGAVGLAMAIMADEADYTSPEEGKQILTDCDVHTCNGTVAESAPLLGEETSMKAFVCKFAWMALGGGGLGFVFGVMGSLCLGYTENGVIETVITIIVAYLGFFIAENQAGVSGILATVAAGISMSALGRTSIRNPQTIHQVWDTIEFCGNTLIFMLAGNIFGVVLAEPNNGVGVYEWSYLSLLWIALLGRRVIYGEPSHEGGGGTGVRRRKIREIYLGVVRSAYWGQIETGALPEGLPSVVLLQSVEAALDQCGNSQWDFPDWLDIRETMASKIVFYAGGIAFLTVLLNGFTTRYLMAMLGMLDSSSAEETLLVYARQGLKNRTQDIYRTLCGDPLLSLHDPGAVQAVCIVLSDERTERALPGTLTFSPPCGVAGVFMGVVLTACFAKFVLPYEWGWVLCFLFGSTLSATDPVAVLSLLKDLGASKHLGMLVAGEALFNDGTAIVLFELFSDVLQ